jgi:type VI secretion system lysozyme-like protein
MAELSLKERLQPALFDRLIDEERYVTTFQISTRTTRLQELKLPPEQLLGVLRAQGLKHDGADSTPTDVETIAWRLSAGSSAPSPAQLKAFVIKPPGAPQGIELQAFCTIESRTSLNDQVDPGARHMISMRRLRECVQRDLSWLLNTGNLAVVQDLSRYPLVARSVLNYGMPSLAGRMVTSVDIRVTAKRLQDAIANYEPRLSRVQVTPEASRDSDEMTLSFKIDAELWGQPVPQHLVLRTSIDVDTGDVRISDVS